MYILLLFSSSAVISRAQTGSLGGRSSNAGGQVVPWWYPSRVWGGADGHDGVHRGEDGWTKKSSGGGAGNNGGKHGGDGAGAGDVSRRRFRDAAFLAMEFVRDSVALGVAEEQERTGFEPCCSVHEAGNDTLRMLGEGVDRCEFVGVCRASCLVLPLSLV